MTRESHHGVTEQMKAGRHRLLDARTLLDNGRWRGAMYIGGYAVECLLKAKLMRVFGCHHLAELQLELRKRGILAEDATVYLHSLQDLMNLTMQMHRLRQDPAIRARFREANRWVPAWRYSPDRASRDQAESFLGAVESVCRWIDNNV